MSKRRIRAAAKMARAEIEAHTDRSNKFSTGLAYEGWQGGYLAALNDVLLILNKVEPSTRHYWNFPIKKK